MRRSGSGPRELWYAAYALLGLIAAGLVPILLPVHAAQVSAGAVGLVMGAVQAGQLSAPVWGEVADRRGAHRKILVGGFLGTALALTGLALTSGLVPLMVFAAGLGLAVAGAATVSTLLVVERHPAAEWDRRLGRLQTGYGAGQVAGLLVAAALVGSSQPFGLWVGVAVAVTAAGIGTTAGPGGKHRSPRLPHPRRHPGEWSVGGLGRHVPHHPARPLAALSRQMRRYLLVWFLAFVGSTGFFALYPLLLASVFGVSTALGSAAFAAAAAVGTLLDTPAGRLDDRFGPLTVLRGALAVKAAALATLAVLGVEGRLPPAVVLLVFAPAVFAWSFQGVAGAAIAAAASQRDEGGGLGAANAVAALGGAIGAVAAGGLAAFAGYDAVPAAAAALVTLALAATFTLAPVAVPAGRDGRQGEAV